MARVCVIGSGISGLTVGNLLKDNNEVVIFEKELIPGGLVKCKYLPEGLFHTCGGHVFNTKNNDVKEWFWKHFNKAEDFVKASRHSVVFFADGKIIPYPIENHIFLFTKETQTKIISDLITNPNEVNTVDNFKGFLVNRFGETLYNLYFKPYNEKVWKQDLSKVPLDWLEGKLPMPTTTEIIINNINRVEEKEFVHSSFFYEKKNGSQFIIDTLSKNLQIICGANLENVMITPNKKWIVNDICFDAIIYCGNIKYLPCFLHDKIVDSFVSHIDALQYHGTTSVFCEMNHNPYSWIYLPDNLYESHRIICTGNFSVNNNLGNRLTGTVEFTDYKSKDDILYQLKKMPLSPRFIDSCYNKYTYPIQYKETREMIQELKNRLSKQNFYLTGRFADWEYYNMDVAIFAAMKLVKEIRKRGVVD